MKKKFCCITPTRGDRSPFDEQCRYLIKRQTIKNIKHIFINYPPLNSTPDLTARVRIGVEISKDLGFERVYIIENDDYYPETYIEEFEKQWKENPDCDIIGHKNAHYYHLPTKQFDIIYGEGLHSSLCTTSLNINAPLSWQWPPDETVFLDKEIWGYSFFTKHTFNPLKNVIGLKHGTGLCGGAGHSENFPYHNTDHFLCVLKRWVTDEQSFNFYKNLIK
jgi:hypothetical protein